MKKFIYLHPVLAVLFPFSPCVAILAVLWQLQVVSLSFAIFCVAWLLVLLSFPVRRAFPALLSEASHLLQAECNVPAFLSRMEILRSRRRLSVDKRLLLEANYALGLDAGGKTDEAMDCLRKCRPLRDKVPVPMRYQFDIAYACVLAHTKEATEELPRQLATLEQGYRSLPFLPPVREMLRRNLDTLQDIARFYAGDIETARSHFVTRIEGYLAHPSMRRSMLLSCMWLARIYEKQHLVREAAAMYRYVAEKGNTLGAVDEAKDALARLMEEEKV